MRKYLASYSISYIPLLLMTVAIAAVALFLVQPKAGAQAPTCRVGIVLDRSGSVGEDNLDTMRAQVMMLFEPISGMNNPNIYLAFWSFSSTNSRTTNYDAPFNGFVSSTGNKGAFETNLNRIVSSGNTNYEQGFGFNGGVLNTFDGMNDIIKQSDIIVFMTDGLPNVPGYGDGNATARRVARDAVVKLRAGSPATGDSKLIVGGMVGNANQNSLNYVINGADTNATDTFKISSNYDDLSIKLKDKIGTKCNELNPPPAPEGYSLTPTVTSNDDTVSGNSNASFSFNVNNSAKTTSSGQVAWSVKRLVIPRGAQSADVLMSGFRNDKGEPFQDNYTCAKLIALVGGNGITCDEVASGQRVFNPGNTQIDTDAISALNIVVNEQWSIGTKVCQVLTIDKPTESSAQLNRFSSAKCLTVGKRPLVQIWGGDVRVGRRFIGDPAPVTDDVSTQAYIKTSLTPRSDGKTYGSWAEYGVFASGSISGFASLAGLANGYPSTAVNIQRDISRLTFANTDDEYGKFTENDAGQGTIPDAVSAVLSGRGDPNDLTGRDSYSLNGFSSGVYQKKGGNLTLDATSVGKGRSLVLYVPDGTVTINGDISYENGPFSAIDEIPQFVIIAKNIHIKQDVVNVDAWLIANGSGADGQVVTCNEAGTLTSQICNKQLRINGPIMARHLDLRRTGPAITGSVGSSEAASAPAEIINLSAASFLWSLNQSGSDVRAQTTFTTELPPYF